MSENAADDFNSLLAGVKEHDSNHTVELERSLTEAESKITFLESERVELLKKLDTAFSEVNGEAGKPLLVAIDNVITDPDKPNTRQEINETFETWLVENIREQKASGGAGVQDPISVRWSETHEKYLINKGHTRHRCAKRAGLEVVPIIIQDKSTDWNQVIENLIRDNLSTKDMVAFIVAKKEQGISQSEIGRRLSRDRGWVSKHAALADLPTFIQTIWDNGYANDFTVLYGLSTIYKVDAKFVEKEANKFIAKKKSITEDDVNKIKNQLRKPVKTDKEEPLESDETESNEVNKDKQPKTKVQLKIQIEFNKQTAYLVLEEASEPGNIVIELKNGSVLEARIDEITIIGVREVLG